MAGKNKVSVSIALEGEQQYRQAIQNINSAQKTLRSEMKTVEQQFKTSANSLEALTSKQNVLQRQYEQQAQKVKVYEQALENATNKEGTAAEKVDKLTKEYEEEQQALDKMRQTMPEATEEIAKQEQKVNDLSNKLSVAQKDYLSAQNATNKYQTSLNYANVELQDLDSELQKNDGYMREAEKSADKTAHSIDQYGPEDVGVTIGSLQNTWIDAVDALNWLWLRDKRTLWAVGNSYADTKTAHSSIRS